MQKTDVGSEHTRLDSVGSSRVKEENCLLLRPRHKAAFREKNKKEELSSAERSSNGVSKRAETKKLFSSRHK